MREPIAVILQQTYPYHQWDEWRFKLTPKGWWAKVRNQVKFLQHVRAVYGFDSMESLYNVNSMQIKSEGGTQHLT